MPKAKLGSQKSANTRLPVGNLKRVKKPVNSVVYMVVACPS
jgi:hypothetical protein